MSDSNIPGRSWWHGRRMIIAPAPSRRLGGTPSGKSGLVIRHPVIIGALGVGALGAGLAFHALRPSHRQGRSARFQAAVESACVGLTPLVPEVVVDVGEGFGKPALVTVDLVVDSTGDEDVDAHARQLLDAAASAVWNNREISPVSVRARVLTAQGERNSADRRVRELVSMEALGFPDDIARPSELFEIYGPPASDPQWRP
ncbi:pyridine nucleotide-disulfide oxidoreductase [Schaalia sp. ZJ405]|uniref:pyridine nucleotide-disulfide oxidoreductase n=1 Tax=unclassified Schaalia TaxID=2691889 RepID=UPI0013EDDA1D|nr:MULTISPECIES: pyridine nucleotide-disulfide oxidoreductase [unclassified Schaalia]QPK81391.1 pyridine nucleotide-disulfide oxidoreductase [Schaalia sp. ZJ405]